MKNTCIFGNKVLSSYVRDYYVYLYFKEVGPMPNIKSAKKRVKVIATKTAHNKEIKSALKTAIKKAYVAIETNADNKAEAVSLAVKKIDQAAAKGIMHKNKASRSKANLAKRLNASA